MANAEKQTARIEALKASKLMHDLTSAREVLFQKDDQLSGLIYDRAALLIDAVNAANNLIAKLEDEVYRILRAGTNAEPNSLGIVQDSGAEIDRAVLAAHTLNGVIRTMKRLEVRK
jgi:hypothetical protein